jgi:hypothetical protein
MKNSSLASKRNLRGSNRAVTLKQQFNPDNVGVAIRKLLFLARNNADEDAKLRLMPIVRHLIQTVLTCKTRDHQPASLQVYGNIVDIMGSLEVLDLMEQQFLGVRPANTFRELSHPGDDLALVPALMLGLDRDLRGWHGSHGDYFRH